MAVPNERLRSLIARFPGAIVRGRGVMSAPLRNAAFALFLGGILAYGGLFAWYMLDRFDLVNLLRDVNGDDSFYYFQIAKNLAEGKFSTFDGGITRTNGYHPLWLFLITPFYWLFDPERALFAIKAFEIMLTAGGVALVALSARLARLPWILLFAALPLLFYHKYVFLAGMESAASLFMLGLLFLAMSLFARNPARWKWHLTVAAFALPWVRLEFAAVSVAATAALLLIEWPYRERTPGASSALQAGIPLFGACSGILAYFAYNRLVFGGALPVSAAIRQVWSQKIWESEGGYSLASNFRDVLQVYEFAYGLSVSLGICACFSLVLWFTRRARERDDRLLLIFLAAASGLAVGHIAKFVQTVLMIHPDWGSYTHYFVPLRLMEALIVPIACYVALHFVRRFVDPGLRPAAHILRPSIVVVCALVLFMMTDFTAPFQFVARASESSVREFEVSDYLGAQVMNRVLPENSVIGSWNSGVLGYFSRFPVVNLDGVVNTWDYLRDYQSAQREGSEAAFFQPYGITHFGITHFADVRHVKQRVEPVLFEGPLFLFDGERQSKFTLWSAGPAGDVIDRSARFWERMEPHFDYQSDGVGILVDGRMAQAFAGDCAPDELVLWSWVGPGDETAVSPWTQTQTGLCTASLVLPRNARPPVRAETMPMGDYAARLLEERRPVIRSDWDVYLSENSLVYVKEPCASADTEAMFFLALYPADANDLPDYRKQHGFANLDFYFDERGLIFDGRCTATAALPEYAVTRIDTGQYVLVEGGFNHLWEAGFDVVEPADDGQAAP